VQKHILLVDDDPEVTQAVSNYFDPADYKFHTLSDGDRLLEVLPRVTPDIVLLDVHLPSVSGLDLLKKIKQDNPGLPVIIVSGQVSTDNAIEAMREGAYEYLTKPFRLEKLQETVERAIGQSSSKRRPVPACDEVRVECDRLVGRSPEIVEIAKMIGQVARSDASVLILGESGTGKELVARALHRNSLRNEAAFISVNCAALPETLLESELFGHEKGAFTGALGRKLGKFEQCDGGTIFLDEIGDMTLLTQSKVLRVLQEQQFERVGGQHSVHVNVRVVAATNKSLVEAMKEGAFRVDLFYRLKVVTIHLPPLRERRADIPLLVEYFIKKYSREARKPVKELAGDVSDTMMRYPWPGNVRELENTIHTAVVLSREDRLQLTDFPLFAENPDSPGLDFDKIRSDYYRLFGSVIEPIFSRIVANSEGHVYADLVAALERSLISNALNATDDNQVQSAQILGVSRNTLRDRMKKYGIL
jgi:DNA-binding NtrC family response regulator